MLQKLVFEATLDPNAVPTTNVVVASIDRNTLGLPSGFLPEPGADGSIVYLVQVKALYVTGDWSYDQTQTLEAMLHFNATDGPAELYVRPIVTDQVAATNTLFRTHNQWQIYVAGRQSDANSIPGSPTVTEGAINIVINDTGAAGGPKGNDVQCKIFVDIYAHGDDTI